MFSDDEGDGPPALPVGGVVSEDEMRRRIAAGPPTSAEDYLQRVRWESQRMPKVFKSSVDSRKFDHLQTVQVRSEDLAPATPATAPGASWRRKTTERFSSTRQAVVAAREALPPTAPRVLPLSKDPAVWEAALYGERSERVGGGHADDSGIGSASGECAGDAAGAAGTPPLLSAVATLDQVTVNRLLAFHLVWLRSGRELTLARCAWLYALLAAVDKPLLPDVASTLCQLLRYCGEQRSAMDADHPRLPAVNLLVTLIQDYFRQGVSS